MPAKTDDARPLEAQLDLRRATLAIDDGLLMVLGPEGDPVPPATVADLATDQPEAELAFDDGAKVPAGRVAEVLAAQADGRLAPAGDDADGWLRAMLGLGPAPSGTGDEELEAERDDLEITLVGGELVIGTAAGSSFVITAVRPGGSERAVARLALGDGTPVGLQDLLARLRRSADPGGDGTDDLAEMSVPGGGFKRDGAALVLTTACGESFRFTAADGKRDGGVAVHTRDGESVGFARLIDALGPADETPDPEAAVADDASRAAIDASVQAEPEATRDDQVERAAATACADEEPAHAAPAAPAEAGGETDAPPRQDQGRAADVLEPSAVRDEEIGRREAGEPNADEPVGGGDAPAPADSGRASAVEGSAASGWAEASDASVGGPQGATIPLACRVGADGLPNVAVVLIDGVPAGAILSAGSDNGDGTWTVPPDQLDALAITLPGSAPERLTLGARLVSIDDRSGTMSTVARDVVVSPEAGDTAAPPPDPAAGIPLDLGAVVREAAADGPASAVVVGGLPAGAELSAGLFDDAIRSWVVRPDELADLRLFPGACASGPLELRVTVVTMDRSTGKPSAATRSIEVAPSPSPTDRPAAARPPQRLGGVGFFRPLYDRRR